MGRQTSPPTLGWPGNSLLHLVSSFQSQARITMENPCLGFSLYTRIYEVIVQEQSGILWTISAERPSLLDSGRMQFVVFLTYSLHSGQDGLLEDSSRMQRQCV